MVLENCRYRDDDVGEADENPSAEGFCTSSVRRDCERGEVRETRAVYRLKRAASVIRRGDAWR